MLLRDGNVLTSGPLDDALTAESLSECFGLPVVLERRPSGRFSAWARR
jgi:iron complex transport system ATP-binding protein